MSRVTAETGVAASLYTCRVVVPSPLLRRKITLAWPERSYPAVNAMQLGADARIVSIVLAPKMSESSP